ncbi:hypothetical protein L1887_61673 [Cichorium endivia]|nr:hypothetical protein L1887_61673 [Cichorium endivia]
MSILLSLNLVVSRVGGVLKLGPYIGRLFSSSLACFQEGEEKVLQVGRAYEIYPSQHCIYRLNKVTFEVDWEGMRIGMKDEAKNVPHLPGPEAFKTGKGQQARNSKWEPAGKENVSES